MAISDDATRLLGIKQGDDRRHKKRSRDVVAVEQREDSRHPNATAEFPPGKAAYGLTAGSQSK